jgi:hypothetical protein
VVSIDCPMFWTESRQDISLGDSIIRIDVATSVTEVQCFKYQLDAGASAFSSVLTTGVRSIV